MWMIQKVIARNDDRWGDWRGACKDSKIVAKMDVWKKARVDVWKEARKDVMIVARRDLCKDARRGGGR